MIEERDGRRREGRNRDEGEGGRMRGEGRGMGIAPVGYFRTRRTRGKQNR
jgi:hypothetical protein